MHRIFVNDVIRKNARKNIFVSLHSVMNGFDKTYKISLNILKYWKTYFYIRHLCDLTRQYFMYAIRRIKK